MMVVHFSTGTGTCTGSVMGSHFSTGTCAGSVMHGGVGSSEIPVPVIGGVSSVISTVQMGCYTG